MKNINDFIYQQPGFNDCSFCTKFNLSKHCPLKDKYKNNNPNPTEIEINKNYETCKNYVISNLKKLLRK